MKRFYFLGTRPERKAQLNRRGCSAVKRTRTFYPSGFCMTTARIFDSETVSAKKHLWYHNSDINNPRRSSQLHITYKQLPHFGIRMQAVEFRPLYLAVTLVHFMARAHTHTLTPSHHCCSRVRPGRGGVPRLFHPPPRPQARRPGGPARRGKIIERACAPRFPMN